MIFRLLNSAAVAGFVLAAVTVHGTPAVSQVLEQKLAEQGWRLFDYPLQKPTSFKLIDDRTIEVATNDSSALIYRPVDESNKQRRYLTWRWRLEQPMSMPKTDVSIKGGDDRPIAVHVWFKEPAKLSLRSILKSKAEERAFGMPISGKILTYVWGGLGPQGGGHANPHLREGSRMIMLRTGDAPVGQWFEERVDLVGDFQKAFGYAPQESQFVAVWGDAEDTHTQSRALISDLAFQD